MAIKSTLTLRAITSENWTEALALTVFPAQQRFVAGYVPIAAIALAKAYVRLGGVEWAPRAIYAGETMVGMLALAFEPGSAEEYWLFHFFIDQRHQGRGYGASAAAAYIQWVRESHPACQALRLVVHPENTRAQRLYTRAGFQPTGERRWGEPVYRLAL